MFTQFHFALYNISRKALSNNDLKISPDLHYSHSQLRRNFHIMKSMICKYFICTNVHFTSLPIRIQVDFISLNHLTDASARTPTGFLRNEHKHIQYHTISLVPTRVARLASSRYRGLCANILKSRHFPHLPPSSLCGIRIRFYSISFKNL